MQSVGTSCEKVRTDGLRAILGSRPVALSLMAVVIIGIWPALASEAFASDSAARGSGMAVARAQVMRTVAMTSAMDAGTDPDHSRIMQSTHTTLRNCKILLGDDVQQSFDVTCELRLIEMH